MGLIEVILAGLLAPVILFFLLGALSVFVKSDLEIPPAATKLMAIFLLVSIGLEGGAETVEALGVEPGLIWVVTILAVLSLFCGAFIAFSTANVLKGVVGLKPVDAWAAGGLYGAVSSATLAVAIGIVDDAQELALPGELIYAGWMPAMDPFLEASAIFLAILLGRMALVREGVIKDAKVSVRYVFHDSFFGMAVWLLVGSLFIGMIGQAFSPEELERTLFFFDDPFRGVLALFMIDMGMAAARHLGALKEVGRNLWKVIPIAFILPQAWGILGILVAFGVHLLFPGMMGWGDAFVFASMTGGASFISAPAAMRAALPEANPSVYLPLSVALTFPFNIMVGIPLWRMVSIALWGA